MPQAVAIVCDGVLLRGRTWRNMSSIVDSAELEQRAALIVRESEGIWPLYEAFYIHSIMYTADRAIEAFERYDAALAAGRSAPDQVSPVHEAMGYAGSLSRFFWSSGAGPARKRAIRALSEARAKKLRAAFQLTDASPLKARSLRDALEHFDERLDEYLLTSDAGKYAPIPQVGDSSDLPNGHDHIFKLVDPARSAFVILDQKFEFAEIRGEVARILLEARAMSKNGDRLRPIDRSK